MNKDIKQADLPEWQRAATTPTEGHSCRVRPGRQYIFQLRTGADPVLAIAEFAKKKGIKYGKINCSFMGAFEPCCYYKWVANKLKPEEWHNEYVAVDYHLLTLGALGGMISQRPTKEGGNETFVAMHFVAGGSWEAGNIVGHMVEGTRVKGCMQCFITELLDIDVLVPVDEFDEEFTTPENFYYNVKGEE